MREEDTRMFQAFATIRVKCNYCGHSNTIPVFDDYKNCRWCGKKIKNNTKAYFKYQIRKRLEENKNGRKKI